MSAAKEEITRALLFHLMVQRGLANADAGRTIPGEEFNRCIKG